MDRNDKGSIQRFRMLNFAGKKATFIYFVMHLVNNTNVCTLTKKLKARVYHSKKFQVVQVGGFTKASILTGMSKIQKAAQTKSGSSGHYQKF